MSGTLKIRLTGEDAVIRAIYNRIRDTSPRGPRGGIIYRCSLKERDHGVMQLYADLPLEVLGDMFAGGAATASAVSQPSLLPAVPAVVSGNEPTRLQSGSARLQIDFRRK